MVVKTLLKRGIKKLTKKKPKTKPTPRYRTDPKTGERFLNRRATVSGVKKKTLKSEIERVKPTKGISIFDFDDTLAKTKEKVIVNMPNGETREISASEFAETAGQLEAEGAEFGYES